MMAQAALLVEVNQAAIEEIEADDDQAGIEDLGPDASIQHPEDEAAALKKHDDEAATEEIGPDACIQHANDEAEDKADDGSDDNAEAAASKKPLLVEVNQAAIAEVGADNDEAATEDLGPDASIQHPEDEAVALKKHDDEAAIEEIGPDASIQHANDEAEDEAGDGSDDNAEAAASKKPLLVEVNQDAIEEIVEVNQDAIEEIGADNDEAAIEDLGPDASIQLPEDEAAALKKRDALFRFYRPLHDAALNGVWADAEKFLDENPDAEITQGNLSGRTILHLAANLGHAVFIKKLLQSGLFPKEAMRQLDDSGYSALHYAAAFRSLSVVKILVSEDSTLTQVMTDKSDISPLLAAAYVADNERVIWYLAKNTTNDNLPSSDRLHYVGAKGAFLVNVLVDGGYYDVVLYLFNYFPQLANDAVDNWQLGLSYNLLYSLTRRADFPSAIRLNLWGKCIYPFIPIEKPMSTKSDSESSPPQEPSTIRSKLARVIHSISRVASKAIVYVPGFKRVRDVKYKHECIALILEVACKAMSRWDIKQCSAYFEEDIQDIAATRGRSEIITALIKHFPDDINCGCPQTNIFLCAIKSRQEHVFNLMMGRGAISVFFIRLINEEARENVLHIAARLAPYTRLTSVSTPPLQMQRELQWFQAVEKIVSPHMTENKNINGYTPRELFTIAHKELVKDAEKWMKDTSTSCLVVATLIITMVFPATFHFPGGNIDGIGIPLFLRRNDFLTFILADGIGMLSAATSILMFLSILTARFAEDDFLRALPKRLILGLASLFIALASMLVAFGVAFYLAVNPRLNWIYLPIIGLTGVAICIFVVLQLPLFIYMVRSTYGSSLLKVK